LAFHSLSPCRSSTRVFIAVQLIGVPRFGVPRSTGNRRWLAGVA
jgi:hypothetical protein